MRKNAPKKEIENEINFQKDLTISLNKILLNNYEENSFNNDSDFSYESGNDYISSNMKKLLKISLNKSKSKLK